MMRQVDLSELRAIQLEILDDVDRYCKENGLHYSLGGGTLLGAVRHKGYIPWDDDIDINMPREDYELFAKNYLSDKNEVQDLRYHPASREICLKVMRKGTKMVDISLGRALWGINIDVFPIDGCPDNAQPLCEEIAGIREEIARVCPYYRTIPMPQKIMWFFRYVLKRLRSPFSPSVLELKKRLHEIASINLYEDCKFAGGILGGYGKKEVMEKSVFADYVSMEFEGKQYPVISGYDTYLKSLYGNYVQLPPEEKRVSHHLYDSYIDS